MFGYLRDHPAQRYTNWIRRFGAAPAINPRDLRPDACRVLDQEGNSCTGHGTATGIYTAAAVAGHRLDWIPSPAGIYTLALATERGDPLSRPLFDQGSNPAQIERSISEYGLRPMVGDGGTDCAPVNGVMPEPDLMQLEVDAEHCYFGWYEIGNADEARAAIAAGAPVGVGTYVDSKFMQWTPARGPIGFTNQDDPDGGGHWTVGLATTARKTFWIRNSWGDGYGDAGDVEVTDDFINQAWQLLAFGYWRIGR
jgi:hypothetical protein